MTYGEQVVGQALKEGGVDGVFGTYGSINLAIEETNRHGVKMYHFRHEQSAGFAANAYARCLRKPGVCFSSSAPGFVNLVSPIAQAKGALSPVVLLNNSSWAGVAAGHDLFYPEMGSWDNLPGIPYDRMFRELGCHTEYVERPEEIVPALERAFSSSKPALVNVVGDTHDVHPFRLRICWGDAWTRGDIDHLPEGARAQLRKAATPGTIQRTRKFWLDNGVDIPAEELAAMADFPKDKL
jgi:thiamine pyrophosphate-dependent acetolactate synthase large subunit-like protein